VASDGDGDGDPDPGDVPLEGVSIRLFRSTDGALVAVNSTTTAADGSFAFTGLHPGEYVTCEESRSNFRLSYPSQAENLVCSGETGVEPYGYSFTVASGTSPGLQSFFNAGEIFGCTPGYWKNHLDRWTGYSPDQSVGSVFGSAPNPIRGQTLEDALNYPGGTGLEGPKRILLRATVATLMNFASGEFNFEVPAYQTLEELMTSSALIGHVNGILALGDPGSREAILLLANQLDRANNAANGCPLEGTPATRGPQP
jgi:hypothetical protein